MTNCYKIFRAARISTCEINFICLHLSKAVPISAYSIGDLVLNKITGLDYMTIFIANYVKTDISSMLHSKKLFSLFLFFFLHTEVPKANILELIDSFNGFNLIRN